MWRRAGGGGTPQRTKRDEDVRQVVPLLVLRSFLGKLRAADGRTSIRACGGGVCGWGRAQRERTRRSSQ